MTGPAASPTPRSSSGPQSRISRPLQRLTATPSRHSPKQQHPGPRPPVWCPSGDPAALLAFPTRRAETHRDRAFAGPRLAATAIAHVGQALRAPSEAERVASPETFCLLDSGIA